MSSDSIIEKSVLAITQLQGHDNWGIWSISIAIALGETWDYVEGSKSSPPAEMNDEYIHLLGYRKPLYSPKDLARPWR